MSWTPLSGEIFQDQLPDLGQTFTADQLPDPEAQRAIGIDPERFRRDIDHLVTPAELEEASEGSPDTIV